MKIQINKFNVQTVMSSIVKYGAHILFVTGIAVMTYLSFVNNLGLDPNIRNITTIALIAMVLNYVVWDSYYQSYYNDVMAKDLLNDNYCIHRRYYNARKGWKYSELQDRIRIFNREFKEAWIQDVEDITGRSKKDIIAGKYRKNDHKILIWRIKHNKIPKSGLKTPRDMLQVLKVGKSGSMSIKVNAAEVYRNLGRGKKLIMSALGTLLAASLIYDFIEGDVKSSLLKLLINIVLLFMSFFLGAVSGNKGGQIKLGIAEEISERLEEWKNLNPSEEPFAKHEIEHVNSLKNEPVNNLDTYDNVKIEIT